MLVTLVPGSVILSPDLTNIHPGLNEKISLAMFYLISGLFHNTETTSYVLAF